MQALAHRLSICFCICVAATAPSAHAAQPLLHAMFQDHAVLQRDRPIAVRGHAGAGEEITLQLASATATARADGDGRWNATLPAMSAGGPYQLSAVSSSGNRQVVQDVLVGDVFLCSGQSNMGLQVVRAANSWSEVRGANNDSIRMVKIAQAASPVPLETFDSPIEWQPTSSQTVPEFSAACYYFARELQKTVRVPIGLIHASWGGSKIEPWMGSQALHSVPGYDTALDVLKQYRTDQPGASRRWMKLWEQWWSERDPRKPWSRATNAADWQAAPASLGAWETWGDPRLAEFDGMVWFRTTLTLTKQQAAQAAVLSIGAADEVDLTWVNGEPIGSSSGPQSERHYALPRGTLKAGENVIVVNVLDTYSYGGLVGPSSSRALQFADGSSLPLDGKWTYQIAPDLSDPPRAPWEAVAGVSIIYNAMIAPIGPYGIKGVVWYQGESNTAGPDNYEALLHAWMADWRRQFGDDLRFLIVQLPNYGEPPTAAGESQWATLRDAQRRAVEKDGHAGLAVAIDVGDRHDLHPANKQDIGRRLARAARHVVYGESIAPSGPTAANAWRDGNSVVVEFRDVEKRLVAYSANGPIGFELCGANAGSCRYVAATLQDNRVLLAAEEVPAATRVRYCWADSPVCTLYDESRLPAGPFELSIERNEQTDRRRLR